MKHYSVLLEESIEGLNIKEDGIYVDATLGYGGHSSEILKKLTKGHLYSFDQDQEAIKYSKERLLKISNKFTIIYSNFVNMKEKLAEQGITSVDGIIFDLGLSSPQIDNKERGFTFMTDAPLDMRMDTSKDLTAYTIVNTYTIEELSNIFFIYGEEKMSKVIAKKIVSERLKKEIKTTKELVKIIESAVGAKYFNKNHPERQIFQAIRIEVNGELDVLKKVLPDAIDLLNKNGRISVITFHSLEDRIVKQIFKKNSEVDDLVKGLPSIPKEYQPKLKLINKKPILPTEKELKENSRSKSAKLRIVERI
ncbi:MAG: 16S rRNA (cytosine(1402)-N(4))-methyltransferase RsmH [Candidatus Coprovivens sp.]